MKSILALRKTLQVIIHSGTGTPIAMRVYVPQLVGWLSSFLVVLLLLSAGTLLFFRELEINRKLQSRLLVFETEEKLWQTNWNFNPQNQDVSSTPKPAAAPQKSSASPVTSAPTTTPASAPAALSQQDRYPSNETVPSASMPTAVAKISELTNSCNGEECQVRLSMSTTGAGLAQGHLLIVLETEVPRIGAATAPEAQMRKRYFFYPEQEPREELEQNAILKLEQKPFRFSRVLKTTANFKVGKLLRPLSVNAYVFDDNHVLLQHERRAFTEEP